MCVYVFTYLNISTYYHTHTHTRTPTHTHTHAHVHPHPHAHAHASAHAHVYAKQHTYTYVNIYIYIYICIYTYINFYAYTYFICIHLYVCIYDICRSSHTYISLLSSQAGSLCCHGKAMEPQCTAASWPGSGSLLCRCSLPCAADGLPARWRGTLGSPPVRIWEFPKLRGPNRSRALIIRTPTERTPNL